MTFFRLTHRVLWRTSFALLLLSVCMILGGCGRDREEELLFAADSPPVTLTYVAPNNAIFSETEQVAIERFQELAPSIEIERDTFQFNVSEHLLETPPPDVILMWDGDALRNAATLGLLSDLSDIWTEGNLAEAYGSQFRDISRFEGTLRFVPAGFNWTGIYYNREIFECYGLTPPPDTWEEFVRICDTLLSYGETPLSLAGQNPFVSNLWFDYLNLRLNGPEFHRELIAGRVSYNDERVARVWETWISLLDRGYFNESPGSTSNLGSMTALVRGDAESPLTHQKAVMALAANFNVADLPSVFANELDFFQFPQMDASLPTGEVSIVFGYVIPADAPNRLEAGAFVGFMGTAEAQELQLMGTGEEENIIGYVPVNREIERDLMSEATEQGNQIVRGADTIGPPLYLLLPDTMRGSFNQVLRRLFLRTNNRVGVAEIQSLQEEGRQKAIQNGEYRQ